MNKTLRLLVVLAILLQELWLPARIYAGPSDTLTVKVTVLDTPPQGTILINNNADYTNSTSVILNLSASDAESSVTQMKFSNDNTNWSTPENYAVTKSWTLSSGDGEKTVYAKFKDAAGNWSNPAADTIILDTIAPVGSVLINNGDPTTNSRNVTLTLSTKDLFTKLLAHFDGTNGAHAYTAEIGGAFTFGGNAELDTAQKVFGASSLLFDGAGDWVTLAASSDWYWPEDFTFDCRYRPSSVGPGVYNCIFVQLNDGSNYMQLMETNGELYFNKYGGGNINLATSGAGIATGNWYHIALVRSGNNWYIFVNGTAKYAGTNSGSIPAYTSGLILSSNSTIGQYLNGWLDEVRVLKGQAAWTANFTPPGGPYTNEPDMGAGAQMQFSNDNFTWSDPENYATTKNWTLSSGDGTKTVYVKFKDAAGNWSDVFSDTIILNSGGLTTTTIDYIYDDLNRLNTVTHSGISATTYTYDELGNMKNQTTTRGAP